MRQNSDVHEEVIGELLAWAGVHPDYASLPEDERVELLVAELGTRRPLLSDRAQLSELAHQELSVVEAAADAVARYGPAAVPNYVISMCQSVSDVLEAAILLKEVGLLDASGPGTVCAGGHLTAVRDDRRPAQRGRRSCTRCWNFRCTARWSPPAATRRR